MEAFNSCLNLSFNEFRPNELTNLSLIGRLIFQKTVNNKVIIAVLQSTWNLKTNVHIKALDRNLVACTFRRQEDRNKIEDMGPWSIKGALLNLKRWFATLTLDKVNFNFCNYWVQIHNLPPNRRNKENLQKLGDHIGEFIRVSEDPILNSPQKFV